jgi:hypothetical protein
MGMQGPELSLSVVTVAVLTWHDGLRVVRVGVGKGIFSVEGALSAIVNIKKRGLTRLLTC